jgi:hypothetical protein
MEMSAGAGAIRYDFLAGENQPKRTLGNERYAILDRRLVRPALTARFEYAAKSAARTLRP